MHTHFMVIAIVVMHMDIKLTFVVLEKELITHHYITHRTKMSFNRYCFHCGDYGHISYNCAMKYKAPKTKLVWVSKSTCTNHERPKYVWVPKVSN